MSSTIDVTVYTLARKFPKLIGKFANGKPVPLGPYTYLQVATLIVGVVTLLTIVGVFDPPKLPALFVGAAIIGPTVVAVRRIGFSMARTSSRMIWTSRAWTQRKPLSTGGREITAPHSGRAPLTPTGGRRDVFEMDTTH
ncbi:MULTISPECIES: hypothetical protein [Mycobacterium]|nr:MULTISPECIES: hypothetical protein [Mycobacterium]GAY17275.1 hypothetical protein MSZK_40010 [Mycobacterium sp. shizuoka-1]